MIFVLGMLSTYRLWAAGDTPPDEVAEEESFVVYGDQVKLTIEPKRCLLRGTQAECRTQILLSWEAKEDINVCLFREGEELELACWEKAVRGASKVLFVGNESTKYQIKNANGELLAEVAFTVSIVEKRRRKNKTRKRRMWGFP